MKFDNKYTDFENNETELTEKELEWFYSVVTKFHQLPEATGIIIVNRNQFQNHNTAIYHQYP